MPAILKGWLDKVLAKGFAYDAGRWFDTAPLFGRKALLVLTTQAPKTSYQANGLNGDINLLLKPIEHTLNFVGIACVAPFIAYGVMDDNEKKRNDYLVELENKLINLANELLHSAVPVLERFDGHLQLK